MAGAAAASTVSIALFEVIFPRLLLTTTLNGALLSSRTAQIVIPAKLKRIVRTLPDSLSMRYLACVGGKPPGYRPRMAAQFIESQH
jgi:hypothetical protein